LRGPRRALSEAANIVRGTVGFWTSRPLLLAVVAAALAAGFAFAGMKSLTYMETEEFCARCHTMSAQVAAHEESPHQAVECAECHVGDGLRALVKAKFDGFQQSIKLITGTYARPIPPAAHKMPDANEICLRCHDPALQTGDFLITRSNFGPDRDNTEQRTALVLRLAGDEEQDTRGIHWHVLSGVEYVAEDEEAKKIPWIGVTKPDGTYEEYIAENELEISAQAGQRAEELKKAGSLRTMSCYDCHNRVGHEFTTPNRALDKAIADGDIDPGLPYIKKLGLDVVSQRYTDLPSAYDAINGLRERYHEDYQWVFLERAPQLQQALAVLAEIYTSSADPEMNEASSDYPSYMGHIDSAGCFRCHDGGHYKIVNGAMSEEPIPSRCSLCHTFPSSGARVTNVMIGIPPETHKDKLWVFEHKNPAASLEVGTTSCNSCHSQTYCSNCHNSGATSVKHDDMYYDHPTVIESAGQQPCAYCHQRPFCERCHESDKEKIFPRTDELTSSHPRPPP
jgi:nitrate/TMAO reductase-like tetraheme cytochrome c subunit